MVARRARARARRIPLLPHRAPRTRHRNLAPSLRPNPNHHPNPNRRPTVAQPSAQPSPRSNQVRHTISGKTAITAVIVTITAGLAPVVSIAPTGFFAPRKVNPSDKLSLYGSATVADLPGQPGRSELGLA